MHAGRVYVIFGVYYHHQYQYNDSTLLDLNVSNLNGTNGFVIHGSEMGGNAGHSLASADLNKNGYYGPFPPES